MKYLLSLSFHGPTDAANTLAVIQTIHGADPDMARFFKDYSRRMLVKLSEESDDNNW
jgi:hypothetical protein